jgi:hypothetical protein
MRRIIIVFWVVAVFFQCLPSVICGEGAVSDVRLPVGRKISGSIEFDCVVRINAPIAQTDSLFFIHYMVSADAIAYDIIWAEPSWEHLNFPYPPFGMSMYADKSQFLLYNAWNDVKWEKDISTERRGIFSNICNDYNIEDAGFAYQSAIEQRLFLADKPSFIKSTDHEIMKRYSKTLSVEQQIAGYRYNISSLLPIDRKTKRDIKICLESALPKSVSFRLLLENPRQYKEQSFSYDESDNLDSVYAVLWEETIPVTGFNIQVRTNKFPDGVFIRQIPALYRRGNRGVLVNFKNTNIGGESVDLPSKIWVHHGTKFEQISARPKHVTLRNVTFDNYRRTPESVSHEKLGQHFTRDPFFMDEQKFRSLLVRYWLKYHEDTPQDDKYWLSNFGDYCLKRLNEESRLPHRLKLLYMSIYSDMMTGNVDRIHQQTLNLYQAELEKTGYKHIANIGRMQFDRIYQKWYKTKTESTP